MPRAERIRLHRLDGAPPFGGDFLDVTVTDRLPGQAPEPRRDYGPPRTGLGLDILTPGSMMKSMNFKWITPFEADR